MFFSPHGIKLITCVAYLELTFDCTPRLYSGGL